MAAFDLLSSLSTSGPQVSGPGFLKCSRKGCEAAAVVEVCWNNPQVHAPERLKSWLACGEHEAFLEDFLKSRGFWRLTRPLGSAELMGGGEA